MVRSHYTCPPDLVAQRTSQTNRGSQNSPQQRVATARVGASEPATPATPIETLRAPGANLTAPAAPTLLPPPVSRGGGREASMPYIDPGDGGSSGGASIPSVSVPSTLNLGEPAIALTGNSAYPWSYAPHFAGGGAGGAGGGGYGDAVNVVNGTQSTVSSRQSGSGGATGTLLLDRFLRGSEHKDVYSIAPTFGGGLEPVSGRGASYVVGSGGDMSGGARSAGDGDGGDGGVAEDLGIRPGAESIGVGMAGDLAVGCVGLAEASAQGPSLDCDEAIVDPMHPRAGADNVAAVLDVPASLNTLSQSVLPARQDEVRQMGLPPQRDPPLRDPPPSENEKQPGPSPSSSAPMEVEDRWGDLPEVNTPRLYPMQAPLPPMQPLDLLEGTEDPILSGEPWVGVDPIERGVSAAVDMEPALSLASGISAVPVAVTRDDYPERLLGEGDGGGGGDEVFDPEAVAALAAAARARQLREGLTRLSFQVSGLVVPPGERISGGSGGEGDGHGGGVAVRGGGLGGRVGSLTSTVTSPLSAAASADLDIQSSTDPSMPEPDFRFVPIPQLPAATAGRGGGGGLGQDRSASGRIGPRRRSRSHGGNVAAEAVARVWHDADLHGGTPTLDSGDERPCLEHDEILPGQDAASFADRLRRKQQQERAEEEEDEGSGEEAAEGRGELRRSLRHHYHQIHHHRQHLGVRFERQEEFDFGASFKPGHEGGHGRTTGRGAAAPAAAGVGVGADTVAAGEASGHLRGGAALSLQYPHSGQHSSVLPHVAPIIRHGVQHQQKHQEPVAAMAAVAPPLPFRPQDQRLQQPASGTSPPRQGAGAPSKQPLHPLLGQGCNLHRTGVSIAPPLRQADLTVGAAPGAADKDGARRRNSPQLRGRGIDVSGGVGGGNNSSPDSKRCPPDGPSGGTESTRSATVTSGGNGGGGSGTGILSQETRQHQHQHRSPHPSASAAQMDQGTRGSCGGGGRLPRKSLNGSVAGGGGGGGGGSGVPAIRRVGGILRTGSVTSATSHGAPSEHHPGAPFTGGPAPHPHTARKSVSFFDDEQYELPAQLRRRRGGSQRTYDDSSGENTDEPPPYMPYGINMYGRGVPYDAMSEDTSDVTDLTDGASTAGARYSRLRSYLSGMDEHSRSYNSEVTISWGPPPPQPQLRQYDDEYDIRSPLRPGLAAHFEGAGTARSGRRTIEGLPIPPPPPPPSPSRPVVACHPILGNITLQKDAFESGSGAATAATSMAAGGGGSGGGAAADDLTAPMATPTGMVAAAPFQRLPFDTSALGRTNFDRRQSSEYNGQSPPVALGNRTYGPRRGAPAATATAGFGVFGPWSQIAPQPGVPSRGKEFRRPLDYEQPPPPLAPRTLPPALAQCQEMRASAVPSTTREAARELASEFAPQMGGALAVAAFADSERVKPGTGQGQGRIRTGGADDEVAEGYLGGLRRLQVGGGSGGGASNANGRRGGSGAAGQPGEGISGRTGASAGCSGEAGSSDIGGGDSYSCSNRVGDDRATTAMEPILDLPAVMDEPAGPAAAEVVVPTAVASPLSQLATPRDVPTSSTGAVAPPPPPGSAEMSAHGYGGAGTGGVAQPAGAVSDAVAPDKRSAVRSGGTAVPRATETSQTNVSNADGRHGASTDLRDMGLGHGATAVTTVTGLIAPPPSNDAPHRADEAAAVGTPLLLEPDLTTALKPPMYLLTSDVESYTGSIGEVRPQQGQTGATSAAAAAAAAAASSGGGADGGNIAATATYAFPPRDMDLAPGVVLRRISTFNTGRSFSAASDPTSGGGGGAVAPASGDLASDSEPPTPRYNTMLPTPNSPFIDQPNASLADAGDDHIASSEWAGVGRTSLSLGTQTSMQPEHQLPLEPSPSASAYGQLSREIMALDFRQIVAMGMSHFTAPPPARTAGGEELLSTSTNGPAVGSGCNGAAAAMAPRRSPGMAQKEGAAPQVDTTQAEAAAQPIPPVTAAATEAPTVPGTPSPATTAQVGLMSPIPPIPGDRAAALSALAPFQALAAVVHPTAFRALTVTDGGLDADAAALTSQLHDSSGPPQRSRSTTNQLAKADLGTRVHEDQGVTNPSVQRRWGSEATSGGPLQGEDHSGGPLQGEDRSGGPLQGEDHSGGSLLGSVFGALPAASPPPSTGGAAVSEPRSRRDAGGTGNEVPSVSSGWPQRQQEQQPYSHRVNGQGNSGTGMMTSDGFFPSEIGIVREISTQAAEGLIDRKSDAHGERDVLGTQSGPVPRVGRRKWGSFWDYVSGGWYKARSSEPREEVSELEYADRWEAAAVEAREESPDGPLAWPLPPASLHPALQPTAAERESLEVPQPGRRLAEKRVQKTFERTAPPLAALPVAKLGHKKVVTRRRLDYILQALQILLVLGVVLPYSFVHVSKLNKDAAVAHPQFQPDVAGLARYGTMVRILRDHTMNCTSWYCGDMRHVVTSPASLAAAHGAAPMSSVAKLLDLARRARHAADEMYELMIHGSAELISSWQPPQGSGAELGGFQPGATSGIGSLPSPSDDVLLRKLLQPHLLHEQEHAAARLEFRWRVIESYNRLLRLAEGLQLRSQRLTAALLHGAAQEGGLAGLMRHSESEILMDFLLANDASTDPWVSDHRMKQERERHQQHHLRRLRDRLQSQTAAANMVATEALSTAEDLAAAADSVLQHEGMILTVSELGLLGPTTAEQKVSDPVRGSKSHGGGSGGLFDPTHFRESDLEEHLTELEDLYEHIRQLQEELEMGAAAAADWAHAVASTAAATAELETAVQLGRTGSYCELPVRGGSGTGGLSHLSTPLSRAQDEDQDQVAATSRGENLLISLLNRGADQVLVPYTQHDYYADDGLDDVALARKAAAAKAVEEAVRRRLRRGWIWEAGPSELWLMSCGSRAESDAGGIPGHGMGIGQEQVYGDSANDGNDDAAAAAAAANAVAAPAVRAAVWMQAWQDVAAELEACARCGAVPL